MTKRRVIPGINIQWPWSQLLLSGEKTIETRTYAIPEKYIGQELALIETPGPHGKKKAGIDKARIIGVICFDASKQYRSKEEWDADRKLHQVDVDDPQYAFKKTKPKHGWPVISVKNLAKPLPAPKRRGIVFASACEI
jgi:hypothetical protein